MNIFDPWGIDIKVGKTSEQRNPILRKGVYHPPVEDIVEQKTGRTRRTFLDDIDAIASGVEAWFEENTGYSTGVTETTIEIARKLGVPEGEIRRWTARRSTLIEGRVKLIKSLLQRPGASFDHGGGVSRS